MELIKNHSLNLTGVNKYVDFVIEKQIKNRQFWQNFIDVFGTGVDDSEAAWSGEFFGKMMRGASLIYTYKKDEEVYEILTDAVIKLLAKQDELGRIASHTVEHEFMGWDIWCRKYVMVGLLHYYDICKDEELKKKTEIIAKEAMINLEGKAETNPKVLDAIETLKKAVYYDESNSAKR